MPGNWSLSESLYHGVLELQNKVIKYEWIRMRHGRDAAEAERLRDRWNEHSARVG